MKFHICTISVGVILIFTNKSVGIDTNYPNEFVIFTDRTE